MYVKRGFDEVENTKWKVEVYEGRRKGEGKEGFRS